MRKQSVLSGVYGYILENIVDADDAPTDKVHLRLVCIPAYRDETGTLVAYLATIGSHKGTTVAGTTIVEANPDERVHYTFAAVARAARKGTTPAVLGRPVDVNVKSWFGVELARLTGRTLHELILAAWRVEGFDAEKAGFTLEELDQAVTQAYAQ